MYVVYCIDLSAVDAKHQKRVNVTQANKVKRRRLLKNMMKYDDVDVFLNTNQWMEFVTSATATYPDGGDALDKALLKMMRLQFACLRFRAGVRFGCLPRLTQNGNNHPVSHVRAQYEILLQKFTNGTFDPKPVLRSVADLLIKVGDAFRGGSITAESAAYVVKKREEYAAELREVGAEYLEEKAAAAVTPTRRRRRRGPGSRARCVRQFPNLTGKRVIVPSEVFNIPGEKYRGVVHEWGQFKNAELQTLWGYHVHYAAGDKYWHIEAEVHDYVVDDSDGDSVSLAVDHGVDEDGNDADDNDVPVYHENDTLVDVESDLYFGDGVEPDWCDDHDDV